MVLYRNILFDFSVFPYCISKLYQVPHCVILFVSLFVVFHSFGDATITGERLQILTYARLLWPLSSEGSLACQTYCDTGHPFKMVSKDPTHIY